MARLVGLDPGDVAGTPPRVAGCPLPFCYLRVSEDSLTRVEPDFAAIRRAGAGWGMTGLSVLSWDEAARRAHARVFVPGVGEDPATGAAAVGLGVFLSASGLVPPDGETRYEIEQGAEMGRPSHLSATVTCAGGRVVAATVGGGVARVAVGELVRP